MFCGALSLERIYKDRQVPPTDERTCVERDDYVSSRDLRPEPFLRGQAADDIDTIHRRMAEIDKERIEAINKPSEDAKQQTADEWGLYWRPGLDKLIYLSEYSIG